MHELTIGTENRSRIERWAPIGGVLFVALMVVGAGFISDLPKADAPEQEIAEYLIDSDNHMRNIIGVYLWSFGVLTFLWFLTRLRNDLRRAEGGTGALSNLTFGAGVAFTAVWMASAAAYASVAFAIEVADAPVSDIDLVRVLPRMGGLLLLLGGGFTGLLLVLAASAVIFRTGVFPRWLAKLGIVAAIGLLFDIAYLNILPLWVWVFVASVVMLVRRDETAPTAIHSDPQVAGATR